MQKRRNSIANALELCLSCTNLSKCPTKSICLPHKHNHVSVAFIVPRNLWNDLYYNKCVSEKPIVINSSYMFLANMILIDPSLRMITRKISLSNSVQGAQAMISHSPLMISGIGRYGEERTQQGIAHSRFAPSQWESALLCNNISHWLGASLESALTLIWIWHYISEEPQQSGLPIPKYN